MGGVGGSFEMSALESLIEKAAFGKNLKAMKSFQVSGRKLPKRANSRANAKAVKEHVGPCFSSRMNKKRHLEYMESER